jgi:hypothetical protein
MGRDGAIRLAAELRLNTTVTSLNLGSNRISEEGASDIAEALSVNTALTALSLRGNAIRCDGAVHFADALEKNSTLKSLNLGGNGILGHGTKRLAEALKVNESLSELVLSSNGIDQEAAKTLTEAVKDSNVTRLDLRGLNVATGDQDERMLKDVSVAIESKRPCMVLSVDYQSPGKVACTSLAGREVAVREPTDLLASLLKAASNSTGMPVESLRLVRPDGACIYDTDGRATLAELLS